MYGNHAANLAKSAVRVRRIFGKWAANFFQLYYINYYAYFAGFVKKILANFRAHTNHKRWSEVFTFADANYVFSFIKITPVPTTL